MAGHTKIGSEKLRKRLRRKAHVRSRLHGTAERPRMSVFRSSRYMYAQAIDDNSGSVVVAISELEADVSKAVAGKPKKERARLVGKLLGERLLGKKVDTVVFDRNGFTYHGRVKELADGAREAGLKF